MTMISQTVAGEPRTDPVAVADAWLSSFASAFAAAESDSLAELLTADATWRDQVAFTWTIQSWDGRSASVEALMSHASRQPRRFSIKPGTTPSMAGELDMARITAVFDFENDAGAGSGVVQLAPSDNGVGWAAAHLMTELNELKGHPWRLADHRPPGRGHGAVANRTNPAEVWAETLAFENREPYVVVLGAGHNGLMVAARLERLGVDTLVLDRTERVGDVWRNRYPSLALHNYTEVNDFPYMPFPPTAPRYMDKEQFADFQEYYAKAMELKIWSSTQMETATYDDATNRWTVRVTKSDGTVRELHPSHVVFANGLNGNPVVPDFPGQESFKGTVAHSEMFEGGHLWTGKKVVVVGAGVSALDIAQDLYEQGSDVTLVQRSYTFVVDVDTFHQFFYADYLAPGASTEIADLTSNLIPLGVLRKRGIINAITGMMGQADQQLLDDLRARGFTVNLDPGGMIESHFSGRNSYYFDIGACRLIADGEIKFASGRGVERFTENGVMLEDGTELEADHVVLATGYTSILDAIRPIIGDDVADRIGSVWRWGDDNEITNVYRKTPQPGLWFQTGTIRDARYGSKYLALQIKAIQEGIFPAGN